MYYSYSNTAKHKTAASAVVYAVFICCCRCFVLGWFFAKNESSWIGLYTLYRSVSHSLTYACVALSVVLLHILPRRSVAKPYRTEPYRIVSYRTVPYRTVSYRIVLYRT